MFKRLQTFVPNAPVGPAPRGTPFAVKKLPAATRADTSVRVCVRPIARSAAMLGTLTPTRVAHPTAKTPAYFISPAISSALDLAELHNIRNRMQVRLGITATHGLLRAVQVGALLGLAASTVITVASPWIHVFGLGAAIFTGILVGSIVIGLLSQKVARARYFRTVTSQPEFKRDMSQIATTRQVLTDCPQRERTGEQNAQLFLAKRIEQEVAWGVKEQFSQVLRGFFGENELILTSKLMR